MSRVRDLRPPGSSKGAGAASSSPPPFSSYPSDSRDPRPPSRPSTGGGGPPPSRPQRSAARLSPQVQAYNYGRMPGPSSQNYASRDSGPNGTGSRDYGSRDEGRGDREARPRVGNGASRDRDREQPPTIREPSRSRSGAGRAHEDEGISKQPVAGGVSSRLLKALQDNGTIPRNPSTPSGSRSGTPQLLPSQVYNNSSSTGSRRSSTASSDPDRDRDLIEQSELPEQYQEPSMALQKVLSAFEQSGRARSGSGPGQEQGRRDKEVQQQDGRGQGRMRRAVVADQANNSKPNRLEDKSYPMTPGFREIEKVLEQIHLGWERTGIASTDRAGDKDSSENEGASPTNFSPVALALELLNAKESGGEERSGGPSLSAFLRLKAQLEKALQLTIQSHYRQFDASVGAYNTARTNIEASQKRVTELRLRLSECREVLGIGAGVGGSVGGILGAGTGSGTGRGAEMKALQGKSELLNEMLKILESIEQLKAVPEKLENLLSEKRFLSASVLLVRSLKAINRPTMLEIGGLSDLRQYLQTQETLVTEILIEELHNHLYLKSYYCEARWKPYTRGQTALPNIDLREDTSTRSTIPNGSSLTRSASISSFAAPRNPSSLEPTQLQRYLSQLSLRPLHDPLLDEPDLTAEAGHEAAPPPSPSAALLPLASTTLSGSTPINRMNPELDSFTYIESLIESLAVLEKLGIGLDTVLQRVPVEVYQLVETTLNEIDERNEQTKRFSSLQRPASSIFLVSGLTGANLRGARPNSVPTFPSTLTSVSTLGDRMSVFGVNASEASAMELSAEILRDFFWTLYSKLDALLQSFRVLYEVALRVNERKDFTDASDAKAAHLLFSLLEVWKPIQSEVKALLHDYLTDDEHAVVASRNPVIPISDVLRSGKVQRDIGKQLFRFKDSDAKSNSQVLKQYEDSLTQALKISIPGLVTDTSPAAAGAANSNSNVVLLTSGGPTVERDPRSIGGGTHRLLVKPDAFNISLLFGPTSSFLARAGEVLPIGVAGDDEHGFSGFLDEFVLHVFLPQLEDKVVSVFQQAIEAPDAFQEDWSTKRVWPVPVVKSLSNLILLIDSLCQMLQSTPFHQEKYGRLVVSVITQYLQKCQDRFKELASRDPSEIPATTVEDPNPSTLKLAAHWAQNAELAASLRSLHAGMESSEDASAAIKGEEKLEARIGRGRSLTATDIITSDKRLASLANLYATLDCFMSFMHGLRVSSEAPALPPDTPDVATLTSQPPGPSNEGFSLPLAEDMAKRFSQAKESYRSLADTILFTLHIEVRIRARYFIGRAFQEGTYALSPSDATEPDPRIADLNNCLSAADEITASTLMMPERSFVFAGLPQLLDQTLVNNVKLLKSGNKYGFVKMSRNVLALQQNLKTFGYDSNMGQRALMGVDFELSRRFWELAQAGPETLMNQVREQPVYSFDQYKQLLCLQCGVDPDAAASGDGMIKSPVSPAAGTSLPLTLPTTGNADKLRRFYNESLIELHALVLDLDDDE